MEIKIKIFLLVQYFLLILQMWVSISSSFFFLTFLTFCSFGGPSLSYQINKHCCLHFLRNAWPQLVLFLASFLVNGSIYFLRLSFYLYFCIAYVISFSVTFCVSAQLAPGDFLSSSSLLLDLSCFPIPLFSYLFSLPASPSNSFFCLTIGH